MVILRMKIPPGYFDFHKNDLEGKDVVLKLCKALYGLKQAPLKWNENLIHSFLVLDTCG